MKKIIVFLVVLTVFFVACKPQHAEHKERFKVIQYTDNDGIFHELPYREADAAGFEQDYKSISKKYGCQKVQFYEIEL